MRDEELKEILDDMDTFHENQGKYHHALLESQKGRVKTGTYSAESGIPDDQREYVYMEKEEYTCVCDYCGESKADCAVVEEPRQIDLSGRYRRALLKAACPECKLTLNVSKADTPDELAQEAEVADEKRLKLEAEISKKERIMMTSFREGIVRSDCAEEKRLAGPEWLRQIEGRSKRHFTSTDIANLLAHIDELREALRELCLFCDCTDHSTQDSLLNRQDPPEVE